MAPGGGAIGRSDRLGGKAGAFCPVVGGLAASAQRLTLRLAFAVPEVLFFSVTHGV